MTDTDHPEERDRRAVHSGPTEPTAADLAVLLELDAARDAGFLHPNLASLEEQVLDDEREGRG